MHPSLKFQEVPEISKGASVETPETSLDPPLPSVQHFLQSFNFTGKVNLEIQLYTV